MTQTVNGSAGALRAAISGPVIGPADPGYEEARRVWNAAIDRRPAVIARCASPADVAAAVTFGAEHDLEITVRGGAHSTSGASVADSGLMVDLSQLSQVSVDPHAKRARVGGGALLADLDAAVQAHGLAVPAGVVSHTGVAGLTLGGGMGWLTRQAGLSIDNLVSAQVVTADGRIRRAAADENPDLFWAIRGGGGNFGVVTEFEFRLHEVGPVVHFGLMFWELSQGPSVLRLAREIIPALPREVNIIVAGLNAPPAPFVPGRYHHRPGYALVIAGFGPAAHHEEVIARIRKELPPLWDFIAPVSYVDLQQTFDDAYAWGGHAYEKSTYLGDLSDAVIDVVTDHLPQKRSLMSAVEFYRLDGAYSQIGEDDTAFGGGRSPRYAAFIVAFCSAPHLLPAERAWARSLWGAMLPHSLGAGSYVNAMPETGEDRVRAAYGPAKYQRLAGIKRQYDPHNLFHHNANIRPA
ncbi:MAG TPA: FAD-binding oxidoreductase [Streptosporangiaceae bacterium]|nr:FAD-binding oxidoreductase [Streptosporangiaceae bacterium]